MFTSLVNECQHWPMVHPHWQLMLALLFYVFVAIGSINNLLFCAKFRRMTRFVVADYHTRTCHNSTVSACADHDHFQSV